MDFSAYMAGVSQRFAQGERIEDQETLRRIFGMPTATPEETQTARGTVPGATPPITASTEERTPWERAGDLFQFGWPAIAGRAGEALARDTENPINQLVQRGSALVLGASLIIVGLVLSARGSVVNLAIGKALKVND